MIYSKNVSDFKDKIEQLDRLIAIYSSNLGLANSQAVRDGLLDGVSDGVSDIAAGGVLEGGDNYFSMFIDRWGTNSRKVGR